MAEVMPINPPKCTDLDYINFIIAASTVFSCTEAARCYPSITDAPSHDCFTHLLQKQPSDTEPLWAEVRKFVTPKEDYLIVDDTTLDLSLIHISEPTRRTPISYAVFCLKKKKKLTPLLKET